MFTSMHLNEVVISKAITGTVTDKDLMRITDSLNTLKRHQERIDRMLRETYQRESLRQRDEKIRPLLEELITATEALHRYLEGGNTSDRDRYFTSRDSFLRQFDVLEQTNSSRK